MLHIGVVAISTEGTSGPTYSATYVRGISMTTTVLPSGATVTTTTPPSADFDIFSADAAARERVGLPALSTEQLARWEQRAATRPSFVEATFRRSETKRHGPAVKSVAKGAAGSEQYDNWSGAVAYAPAGASFDSVSGHWTVPTVNAVTTDRAQYNSSFWIGIDGDGSADVFQAGVECDASAAGGEARSVYAWWEWYPEYEMQITNFPVTQGDALSCFLSVTSKTSGTVLLSNLTTGTSTTFKITAPTGTTLAGNCAEWIAERPMVNGTLSKLPSYGEVDFTNASGQTSAGKTITAAAANNVNMTDGATIISEGILGPNGLVRCVYSGAVASIVKEATQVIALGNADGRLDAFYIGTNNTLYHTWQTAPNGPWSGENYLGTPTNQAKEIAVGRNQDGRLEVFYIGTNDVLYHTWQTTPNGLWSGESLLGAPTNAAKRIAVGQNKDGRLEVFYIGTNDVLFHTWQVEPNGSWSGENLLGAATNKGEELAVATNQDGRLEVFYVGTNSVLYHTWQTTAGGGWSGESLLGKPSNAGKQIAVAVNGDGRLEVFYVGTNDVLFHTWQVRAGGAWSGENVLGTATNKAKRIAVGRNKDQRLEVFYIGTNNVLFHTWQTAAGAGWSGESYLGTATNAGNQLSVASNQDGRLEAFYAGTNDVLYHTWQEAAGGGWSGENEL